MITSALAAVLAAASLPITGPTSPRTPHASTTRPEGVTLTVIVSGATTPGGTLGTVVFATAEGFPDGNLPPLAILHPHTTAVADTFVFRDVPPGRYAVAVQHDLNANGSVDRNFGGAPKEPWGVSSGIRHTFRAPRFDEAAFDLRADMRIDVRVAK